MGRFSPTVKPTAAPAGLGSLAQALQSGMAGYQGAQDRQEAQRSRQFTQDIQRGNALRQGVTVDTPAPAETFGSAFSRALSGAPEPTPRAVVPRAFVPQEGRFEDVDPITGQPKLPIRQSGNVTYDPNLDVQAEMASATAKGNLGLALEQKGREQRRGELTTALGSVRGAPTGAAASESAAADWLGRPPERGLRLGDPGYAEAMADVASARYGATGGGQNRPPTEVESKDYIFAGLMENSMDDIRTYADAVRPEVITAIRVDPTGLAKIALSDEEQLFVRAIRDFAAAALRKETGAAIRPEEISDVFDRMVDTGFDRPLVRKAKAKARENYLNLLRRTSARARNYYDRVSGEEPLAPATPKSTVRKEDFMPPEND